MKLFSPVPVIMCALLLTAVGVGSAFPAYAEPSGAALSSANAQDAAQDSSAPAVAGSWQISFTDPQGNPRQGTLQIEQNGSTLNGTFQGERGSAPLTGSMQGTQVSLTAKAHGHEIDFTGTVDGSKMSGTTGQGTSWTATRQ